MFTRVRMPLDGYRFLVVGWVTYKIHGNVIEQAVGESKDR